MKKFFTSVVLFATAMFAANAQQLQTGDTFEYTNSEGVVKTYKVVGENLVENPDFNSGAEGWVGGDGNAIGGYELKTSGGACDGGSYLVPGNGGKGGNASIGTAWEMEKERPMYLASSSRTCPKQKPRTPQVKATSKFL